MVLVELLRAQPINRPLDTHLIFVLGGKRVNTAALFPLLQPPPNPYCSFRLFSLSALSCPPPARDPAAMEQRYLRWHGWLVRYAIGGSQDPSAPAVLLVHGFGASADQWDRVFEEFAPSSTSSAEGTNTIERGKGVKLLALDLVGFGHSAKPPLSFSQYSWADCARDVALRAGGGPFFIAGNSIGG